jgi:uncharacterized protein YbgA (DUF1722 family)
VGELFRDYGALLSRAFAAPPKYTAAINVLMHVLGYFKEGLTEEETKIVEEGQER